MEELAQALQQEYGWRLDPGWSNNDIDVFYQVGRDMQQCIQELAGADGAAWIRHCFGPARIRKGSLINQLIQRNFVLPSLDVWLLPGTVRQIIVHELAHVLDNALKKEEVSRPPSPAAARDALIRRWAGKPRGLRFFNGSCDLPPQHGGAQMLAAVTAITPRRLLCRSFRLAGLRPEQIAQQYRARLDDRFRSQPLITTAY